MILFNLLPTKYERLLIQPSVQLANMSQRSYLQFQCKCPHILILASRIGDSVGEKHLIDVLQIQKISRSSRSSDDLIDDLDDLDDLII